MAGAETQPFKPWLHALKEEAVTKEGISRATVNKALPDDMQPLERVVELDQKQPEGGTISFDDYLKKAVSDDRVTKGNIQSLAHRKLLKDVEAAYGVDRGVIVALWGIETSYGRNTGGFDVVAALTTLAYEGRRGDFFRGELFKALKILDEGHVRKSDMKGSWAGAMGQTQFMPSSFFKFAVDYNKDGRRDIWNTYGDIFASAANYLAESGWKKGAPWGRRVKVPANLDEAYLGVNNTYSLQFWHDKGVRLPSGQAVPFEGEYMASVIQPNGPGTTAYLVYDNFRTILKWNKSSYFAAAVCTLAGRIK